MTDDNLVAEFHCGHWQATGRTLRGFNRDATIHFLIVHIDPLALQAGIVRIEGRALNAEFRGRFDDVAVALHGQLGSLDSLAGRRGPYPIALSGEIDGQKALPPTTAYFRGTVGGEEGSEVMLSVRESGEIQWLQKLQSALKDQRFELYTQPIVPATSRTLIQPSSGTITSSGVSRPSTNSGFAFAEGAS